MTEKIRLHRHRDDHYWDEVLVVGVGASLHGTMVPRYKTSGMSGDEWRVSAQLRIFGSDATKPVFERSFGHGMNGLLKYAPHFVWLVGPKEGGGPATLTVKRKGIVLFSKTFDTYAEAAIGMCWHATIASEQGSDWRLVTDEEERAHCQQVGCSQPPVNVYRIKAFADDRGDKREPNEYEGRHTWYCARHTQRGDCGIEDSDDNIVLVHGKGVPRVRAGDESPSGFAGMVMLEAGIVQLEED